VGGGRSADLGGPSPTSPNRKGGKKERKKTSSKETEEVMPSPSTYLLKLPETKRMGKKGGGKRPEWGGVGAAFL